MPLLSVMENDSLCSQLLIIQVLNIVLLSTPVQGTDEK